MKARMATYVLELVERQQLGVVLALERFLVEALYNTHTHIDSVDREQQWVSVIQREQLAPWRGPSDRTCAIDSEAPVCEP